MMTTNFSYSVQKYDPSWCPAGTWNNITKSGYITSTIWLAPTTNYTVLLIKSAYYCKVYTRNVSGYYAPGIPINAPIIAGNVLIK
ncbi:MAG: hypothetical protein KGH64_04485 [Candidatus Micrarchaeota archaeon]|nr:hypothetical protein [Candidatus Micrarchaeota archaeon]